MGRFLSRVHAAVGFSRKQTLPKGITPLDLLGRPAINLDTPELQRFIGGKRVLVTGAGGSIGSEICRQAMKFCPAALVLLDHCENALFEIDRELRDSWLGTDLRPIVADITDATRIEQVMAAERPQVVFHAAAHKHVPLMEKHPGEAVKNNVFGTKTIADASLRWNVQAFVMISSDKAVNPTSVMGATKRVAELYVQSLNEDGMSNVECRMSEERFSIDNRRSTFDDRQSTRFTAVRFGNVLGSSGSVVPIFQKQIAAGGPVTVTHADMRRYFMTIPEASQLVMQAGAIGRGGEIFILDMGEPVRIIDLAKEMIRRAGLVIGRDIELKITGIRPGEKLYEELANDSDDQQHTSHPKINVWKLPSLSRDAVDTIIDALADVIDAPQPVVVSALARAVDEYRPNLGMAGAVASCVA